MPLHLTRRTLLRIAPLGGLSTLLSSCGAAGLERVLHSAIEPVNQKVEGVLFNPQRLAADLTGRQMQPEDLLVNDFLFNSGRATPILDPATFELEVSGRVAHPRKFSLQELQSLPAATVTMRHVCVEGWAAIVRWTGVPLKVLADLVQPEADVRYVYFFSADNYYESWDLASATHPQTLMVYGMNDGPLAQAHGAPIRLASPIKLGYKQSKWVTAIGFTSILLPQKGYWEDQGYEWFAGL